MSESAPLPQIVAVESVLELAASERGDYLLWMVKMLEWSAARTALDQIVRDWQTDIAHLAKVAGKAASDLDRIEQRRAVWRHPEQCVGNPNVPALYAFAQRRADRVPGIRRTRRLEVIARRLSHVYDLERRRRELERFLSEPAEPIDPAWLRDFLQPQSIEGTSSAQQPS